MAIKKFRIPGLQIPVDASGETLAFFNALKERLELFGGERGDPQQRAVSVRELREAGVAGVEVQNKVARIVAPRAPSPDGGTSAQLDLTLLPAVSLAAADGDLQLLVQGESVNDRHKIRLSDLLTIFGRLDQESAPQSPWSFEGDPGFELRGPAPRFRLVEQSEDSDGEASRPADENIWEVEVDDSELAVYLTNDDEDTRAKILSITRTGTTGDAFNVLTTALQQNGEQVILDAENVGAGGEVFKDKANDTLRFRTLAQGAGITITQSADELEIASSGGGGGALVYVNTTIPAGNTVANSSSEVAFDSSYDIPADSLAVGSIIRIVLYGVYGTDATPPTLRLRIKLDSTTIIDTSAITLTGSLTTDGWCAYASAVVTAIGAGGTINPDANVQYGIGAADAQPINAPGTVGTAVDTTVDQTVTATVEWGTADTDNTITLRHMAIWLDAATAPMPAAAEATATFLTEADETASLPNSRRQLAGTNMAFDDSVPGKRTLNATGGAPDTATYLTEDDETGTLVNSRRQLAGTNITFDDSIPGERTLNATGGSGGGNVTPDTHPASPDAMDDEFEAGSLDAKWSWRNQGTSTVSFANGAIVLLPQLSTGSNSRCLEQPLPAGNWKIRAKLTGLWDVATAYGGLHVTENVSGKQLIFVFQSSNYNVHRMDSPTSFNSGGSTAAHVSFRDGGYEDWRYFEIEYDGNLHFRISFTGVDGTFRLLYSTAPGTFLGAPATHIGFHASPDSGSVPSRLLLDWFRRIS